VTDVNLVVRFQRSPSAIAGAGGLGLSAMTLGAVSGDGCWPLQPITAGASAKASIAPEILMFRPLTPLLPATNVEGITSTLSSGPAFHSR
jgi:hypothetical protein